MDSGLFLPPFDELADPALVARLAAEAEDEEAIHARLAADPWTANGMLRTVSVEPWTIRLDGRGRS